MIANVDNTGCFRVARRLQTHLYRRGLGDMARLTYQHLLDGVTVDGTNDAHGIINFRQHFFRCVVNCVFPRFLSESFLWTVVFFTPTWNTCALFQHSQHLPLSQQLHTFADQLVFFLSDVFDPQSSLVSTS